ncbi:MAG: hypothetical protein DRP09_18505 [Candidatus Thorarchaeota archaeon]|nr:MAG: hypothetical protein DRP09_18505 [Candidatus Thorarchaeota archaeon]
MRQGVRFHVRLVVRGLVSLHVNSARLDAKQAVRSVRYVVNSAMLHVRDTVNRLVNLYVRQVVRRPVKLHANSSVSG